MTGEGPTTIAVLTDLWPSASDPVAGVFVRAQVAALAERYRQVVLVPRLLLPGLHGLVWGSSPRGRERGWSEPSAPGRLLRYPYLRVPKLGEAEVRAAAARRRLELAAERPALVHGHFLHEVGVAAVRIARALGVPGVVTVHGTDARWLLEGGVQERFRLRMLEAACAADAVVAVAPPIAQGLVRAGVAEERILTLPMGVDETVFRPGSRDEARAGLGLDPERPLVVFVGRPTPEKGIDELAAAAQALAGRADLVVIGPAQPGTRRGLRFVGAEPPDRVALWLAAAHVFCLPSRAEGTPVSVLEALACGRPVVATTVGGIPHQVGVEAGLLVAPGDADALAAALVSALETEWDAGAIREASKPFWWSRIADRLAGLYAELLRR